MKVKNPKTYGNIGYVIDGTQSRPYKRVVTSKFQTFKLNRKIFLYEAENTFDIGDLSTCTIFVNIIDKITGVDD